MTALTFTQHDGTTFHRDITVSNNQIYLASFMPGQLSQSQSLSVLVRASHHAELRVVDDITHPEPLQITIQAHTQYPVYYQWKQVDASYPIVTRTLSLEAGHAGTQIHAVCVCKSDKSEQVVLHTEQSHTASHTHSTLVIRGVSQATSRVTVKSNVTILDGIAGVKAHQVHKHLLLDKGARVISEPILEVLSDDVSCSHGAAIRYLDEQQLFYLKSRGYSDVDARKTLVDAFLRL